LFREWVGFISETLIFIISGLVIGDQVILGDKDIFLSDWFKLIGLYLLLHVIRFIVIVMQWPLLKISGYGITFKQIIVLTYGGLRGAVGLALALIVTGHHDMPMRVKDMVLFHTAGIATLTILINGTTTGYLVKKFKLSGSSDIQKKIMGNILHHYLEFTAGKIKELKRNENYRLCNWYYSFYFTHFT
jgi:NhaP-type Na+/H+ or K+/H+ antiporter